MIPSPLIQTLASLIRIDSVNSAYEGGPGERVVVWVDGNRYTGDPRAIALTQHLDVTIEVGPPYAKPAPFTAWNGN